MAKTLTDRGFKIAFVGFILIDTIVFATLYETKKHATTFVSPPQKVYEARPITPDWNPYRMMDEQFPRLREAGNTYYPPGCYLFFLAYHYLLRAIGVDMRPFFDKVWLLMQTGADPPEYMRAWKLIK